MTGRRVRPLLELTNLEAEVLLDLLRSVLNDPSERDLDVPALTRTAKKLSDLMKA